MAIVRTVVTENGRIVWVSAVTLISVRVVMKEEGLASLFVQDAAL